MNYFAMDPTYSPIVEGQDDVVGVDVVFICILCLLLSADYYVFSACIFAAIHHALWNNRVAGLRI